MLALPKSYRLQMEKKIILCLPYQKVIAFKWKKVNFMLALPKSYRLQMEKKLNSRVTYILEGK